MTAIPSLDVVAEADNGHAALESYRLHRPDVVVLDLRMPGLNGLGAARLLQQRLPAVKVVMFTMDDSPEYLEAAMNAGAVGYLLKDASRAEVRALLEFVQVFGDSEHLVHATDSR